MKILHHNNNNNNNNNPQNWYFYYFLNNCYFVPQGLIIRPINPRAKNRETPRRQRTNLSFRKYDRNSQSNKSDC